MKTMSVLVALMLLANVARADVAAAEDALMQQRVAQAVQLQLSVEQKIGLLLGQIIEPQGSNTQPQSGLMVAESQLINRNLLHRALLAAR